MKKLFVRLVVYVLSFVVFVGGIGFLGLVRSQKDFYGSVRHEPVPAQLSVDVPKYDPHKPTVAVLLANVYKLN